ncbi:MAG: Ku protein [Woeseiaceae bacterium]|nr:Ku protein [Woeseiaceae bacterium]
MMLPRYSWRIMAARALASATISFGLVSIPVKLFTAYESGRAIRFNQINKADGARVKQQLVSSVSGDPVAREDIVKGYEFAKGQYVLFEPEELKAIEAQATHMIDIKEFLETDQVPRIYLDRVYYLGTDKGGARAYHLLLEAMKDTNRVALGTYAARGKQYLVLVRPFEDGLAMEQLRYADEIRDIDQVPIDEAEVKPDELSLARQLISQAASEGFNPADYRDEVYDRLKNMIEQKVQGEEITLTPTDSGETKVVDLMAALKASIDEDEERKPAKAAPKKKKKAASKKKAAAKK